MSWTDDYNMSNCFQIAPILHNNLLTPQIPCHMCWLIIYLTWAITQCANTWLLNLPVGSVWFGFPLCLICFYFIRKITLILIKGVLKLKLLMILIDKIFGPHVFLPTFGIPLCNECASSTYTVIVRSY